MADETRSKGTVRWFDDHKCFGFFRNLNDDDVVLNDIVADYNLASLDIIPAMAAVDDDSSKPNEERRSWLIVPAPLGFSWDGNRGTPDLRRRDGATDARERERWCYRFNLFLGFLFMSGYIG
ncbi:hypothetical protein RHMOL_Rhmol08G0207000 [Rhododendron molle]|uniref:Uncharacterized protein n=1 Tax=Rhododendron molle TaxID=49168 RepID=A0ACC0MSM6_RHOML|nr:hypothetical protein RHMOL_Rhmol08G0207000 [Rhododendron molle]